MDKNAGKLKKLKLKMEQLLNKNRTSKNQQEYSHVSLGGLTIKGKFNFDKEGTKELYKILAKAVDYNMIFSIAEMPQDYGPVKVDIDLNLPEEDIENDRLYDEDMILKVMDSYRTAIKKYCNVTNKELECYVLEKDKYSIKNEEIKDGFHLLFPYLTLHKKIRHLIVNDVIEMANKEELFSNFSNPSAIDKQVVSSNPWMMYGCSKPHSHPYKLIKILDVNNSVVTIPELEKSVNIVKMLSLKNKRFSKEKETDLNDDVSDDYIETNFDKLGITQNSTEKFDDLNPLDNIERVMKAIKLTEMLSKKRADKYTDWIRVGWALHNTDKSLLDTWIDFSKRSKKYKEGECQHLWRGMRDSGYTDRSLMAWAGEDSPLEYKQYLKEEFNNLVKKNAPNNTFGVAEALQFKYYGSYVCVSPKENLWYEFKGHRWTKCIQGGTLIVKMSKDFSNEYITLSQKANSEAMETNGSDKKDLLEKANIYNKIAESLLDINYKERILKEAKYLFHDSKFLERLDEDHMLIGFENGVYDLDLAKFREGRPDDHISMSTKVEFFHWKDTNPYAKKIKKFFSEILTNENVREYFLSRLSSCVAGRCEEKFYFCTGSGSNGKSLTFQLLSEALGDYYISCPITIITRKRGASNQASPELARLKGPRAGVFQEPGDGEELNVGIFKELSGNDRFMVRALYKEPIEVVPQVKYWLTCNDLPQVKSDDGGTWRRIEVFDFSSKFVDNPNPENSNEFPIDMSLKQKMKQWAPAFASYLIHRYTTEFNTPNKISAPPEVKCSTDRYRKDQDVLREYFDGNLEVVNDLSQGIKKRDLWTSFKLWFKEFHDSEPLPKSKKLNEFMEKSIKKEYKPQGYPGLIFKNTHNDSDGELEAPNDLDL